MLSVKLQVNLDPDPGGDPDKRFLTILAIFETPGGVTPVVVRQSVMSTAEAARLVQKLDIQPLDD